MIDYEKLREAHELAKISSNYSIEIVLGIGNHPDYFLRYSDENGNNSSLTHFSSIDTIISNLQEITKPESKYKVGDIVWVNHLGVLNANCRNFRVKETLEVIDE